ncbi:MAG: hypothetical protein V2A79_17440, partial [Planctomycetota bacterium]
MNKVYVGLMAVVFSALAGGVVPAGQFDAGRGSEIWLERYEAAGAGVAVVGSGIPETGGGRTIDGRMEYFVTDETRPGELGARYTTNGWGEVSADDLRLRIDAGFHTGYAPSTLPGGDTTFGDGLGSIDMQVAFAMPAERVLLHYEMAAEETYDRFDQFFQSEAWFGVDRVGENDPR